MRVILATAVALCVALPVQAPARQDDANNLTHGMVELTLKVGETSQGEILEKFGGPNVATIDGQGNEMWVYDRHATVTSNSSSGFSIGMLLGAGGDGVAGGGGLGFGKRKSQETQSSRTMTLIIKFDARKIVSDFRSRSSSF